MADDKTTGGGNVGVKFDGGKSEVAQGVLEYFPRAMLEVANVSSYGARKYDWNGWQTVPDGYNRYSNAHGRHELLKGVEGDYDTGEGGSGLIHDAQVAWNALARLEIGLKTGRYKTSRGYPLPAKPSPASDPAAVSAQLRTAQTAADRARLDRL